MRMPYFASFEEFDQFKEYFEPMLLQPGAIECARESRSKFELARINYQHRVNNSIAKSIWCDFAPHPVLHEYKLFSLVYTLPIRGISLAAAYKLFPFFVLDFIFTSLRFAICKQDIETLCVRASFIPLKNYLSHCYVTENKYALFIDLSAFEYDVDGFPYLPGIQEVEFTFPLIAKRFNRNKRLTPRNKREVMTKSLLPDDVNPDYVSIINQYRSIFPLSLISSTTFKREELIPLASVINSY